MKFNHKTLLTASLVVSTGFLTFTLFSDLIQNSKSQAAIENNLNGSGQSTANLVEHWFQGRRLLIEILQNAVTQEPSKEQCKQYSTSWCTGGSVSKA